MRPARVDGIERVNWSFNGKTNDYAAVFHSAWQAPDGRHAVVLANWTAAERQVTVRDGRFDGRGLVIHRTGTADGKPECILAGQAEGKAESIPGSRAEGKAECCIAEGICVTVPPLGCVMVTTEREHSHAT